MSQVWQIMSARTGATFITVSANTALDALDKWAGRLSAERWAQRCARLGTSAVYRVDDWRIFI